MSILQDVFLDSCDFSVWLNIKRLKCTIIKIYSLKFVSFKFDQ